MLLGEAGRRLNAFSVAFACLAFALGEEVIDFLGELVEFDCLRGELLLHLSGDALIRVLGEKLAAYALLQVFPAFTGV